MYGGDFETDFLWKKHIYLKQMDNTRNKERRYK